MQCCFSSKFVDLSIFSASQKGKLLLNCMWTAVYFWLIC